MSVWLATGRHTWKLTGDADSVKTALNPYRIPAGRAPSMSSAARPFTDCVADVCSGHGAPTAAMSHRAEINNFLGERALI